MRRFAALYQALDASTATGDKVAALGRYFALAPAADAAWAVYFLAGGKPRQVVPVAVMRGLACRLAGIDEWLFEECYQAVGDLAETIAHVLPAARATSDDGLAVWVEQRLLPLRGLAPEEQAQRLAAAFAELDGAGRFLLVKLIGGGFRVGVSKLLVQRALAELARLDAKVVALRMMGYAEARATPSADRFAALIAPAAAQTVPVAMPSEGTSENTSEGTSADTTEGALRAGLAPADAASAGQPYPFFLAHALPEAGAESLAGTLGAVEFWQIEWKYDGIRAQLVRRGGGSWIWSRGEELVTERFPEVVAAARALPAGSVLDGELLAWHEGSALPAPFNLLQQRIGRKTLGKKILAEAPVVFVAYDLLESEGVDRRGEPQHERRRRLEALPLFAGGAGSAGSAGGSSAAGGAALRLAPRLAPADWAAAAALRASARERGVEGLMLKQRQARYGSGRTKSEGTWWKWKVEPFSLDAVLVYAQAGHGRRAGLYTDYTFALWSRPPRDAAEAQAVVDAITAGLPAPRHGTGAADELQLLPFAKAYSGLSDEEFKAVDREIRAHTLTKFGPVRSVVPTLVFEIGFEGVNASPRHKSGVAVRFPRMLRIRSDKPLHEADSMLSLRTLLPP